MKNIEDRLDSFEQVLSILIKKITVLEGRITDTKVCVDETTQTMLADIQVNLAKMPSGNMLISELAGIEKQLSRISDAQQNPRSVALNLRTKAYFISIAALLCTTVASLTAVRCSHSELESNQGTVAKYEVAQLLAPGLTSLIDTSFYEAGQPPIDSLRHAWMRMASQGRKSDHARLKRR
ncbi:hypothetical protein [Dyadobacter sandarakinus]|uniref:Uncharacterized protein n=1 Tax=Dyadobacter sandarakinus TaxID=2747268 RepID=A0ABX7I4M7_9BACT|nr:hypothetical protein [Dyadobacter sandarakinus]QRR00890.1 hypothetical protein HWI92_08230 [Dyadobacter sandarakinus]